MKLARRFGLPCVLLFGLALTATACGDDEATDGKSDGSDGDTGGGPGIDPANEDPICLINNCSEDAHCGACPDGKNICNVAERRCVACDASTGVGCPEGLECTAFGNCVPIGLECPVDDHGDPTITCASDADCAACDPNHQVCDAGKCVDCSAANQSHCGGTELCVDNNCAPKCPADCDADADCVNCAGAPACNAHKCAECSPTMPCPNGQICTPQGTCDTACGLNDTGSCNVDADCAGCEGASTCVNGACGLEAQACEDLGQFEPVLPSPFDQVTALCDEPSDCAGVGADVNVGKLLRDLTGISQINDAYINYPMSSCASVTIGVGGFEASCGLCVPCQTDNDCADIDVDQVSAQAFGPIGSLAAAFLLDQVFGPNDHKIYMYCEDVAAGYGICAPCPGLLYDCSIGGGTGGGSGSCDHDACTVGSALDGACDSCAATVCAIDSFCCNNNWDSLCVQQAEQHCGLNCSGGGGGNMCSHDECAIGGALVSGCSTCATAVCNDDPFCCNNSWDALCVSKVDTLCNNQCSGGGGGGGCAHPECSTGVKLSPGCSPCATAVCNADPYCCNNQWDSLCVSKVDQYCSFTCN